MGGIGAAIASEGLNAAMNVGGNFLSNYLTNKNAEKAYKRAERWYNDYQSPSALKEAYSKAGFSPYAVLGASSPQAQSFEGAAADISPNADFSGAMSKGMQMESAKVGLETQKANKNYIEAQTEGIKIDNANKEFINDFTRRGGDLLQALKAAAPYFSNWDSDKFSSLFSRLNTAFYDQNEGIPTGGDDEAQYYDNIVRELRQKGIDTTDILNSLRESQKKGQDISNINNDWDKLLDMFNDDSHGASNLVKLVRLFSMFFK